MVKVKDKLAKQKFPGVVYTIPCAGCEHVYIGETGDFGKRLEQHNINKHMATNALAEHAVSTGYGIDWDSVNIIVKEKNKTARLYLKFLHIQMTAHTLKHNAGNPRYTLNAYVTS